jgi:hypothetical protein
VGQVVRKEAERLIVGYTFDLRANTLVPETIPNPSAGREHEFCAWRVATGSRESVVLRDPAVVAREVSEAHAQEATED